MNKLVQAIEVLRQKLPGLRRHRLKETPTRTIVIDPLLEALGWNVRDPDEVQLEFPTVDGKSVDYALKLNKKPVLLVEAKALDDSLDDVKAVTQVVGYAANNGIVWCILTNGTKWRVYRSVEKCPAPDKLMCEIDLDQNTSEGMAVGQIAKQMWRFSCEGMAKGILDALGEQTFTDSKVRKALANLMADPPRPFVNMLRKETGDGSLGAKQIRDSLLRIAQETGDGSAAMVADRPAQDAVGQTVNKSRSLAAAKAWKTRRTRKDESPYDEGHHLSGRPQEAISLYRALDRFCISLAPGVVFRRYLAKSVNYEYEGRCFCSVHVFRGGLRVWLRLKYQQIEKPPGFARDVSNVGHWGRGDLELRIGSHQEMEQAPPLVRSSFEAVAQGLPGR